jgi:molybdate transport system substrate-binding protein
MLTAGAFEPVVAAMLPAIEAVAGDKITLRDDTVGSLMRRIGNGETFDVVVATPAGLATLLAAGKILAGSDIRLAKVGIGVGVKTGAPLPDVQTVGAFRGAMLHARAVAYIDPASGGSSGIYLTALFRTMGIAEQMAAKAVLVKGGLAAEAVVDGRADVVAHQISEIMAVRGVTLAGPLPTGIQQETTYAGAVAAASNEPDAARRVLLGLTGPAAAAIFAAKGMMPP